MLYHGGNQCWIGGIRNIIKMDGAIQGTSGKTISHRIYCSCKQGQSGGSGSVGWMACALGRLGTVSLSCLVKEVEARSK